MQDIWFVIINASVTFLFSTITYIMKEKKARNDIIKKILKVEILLIDSIGRSDILDQELDEILSEYYERGGNGYIKRLMEERRSRDDKNSNPASGHN